MLDTGTMLTHSSSDQCMSTWSCACSCMAFWVLQRPIIQRKDENTPQQDIVNSVTPCEPPIYVTVFFEEECDSR